MNRGADLGQNSHDKIQKQALELKEFIKQFDTESVLDWIANELCMVYTGKNIFSDTKLSSPYKQYSYLAGLILSTNEEQNKPFEKNDVVEARRRLEEIVMLYNDLFYPRKDETNTGLGSNWYEARRVSMPVFLNYFNTSELNYEEQIEERIKRWFLKFEEYIKETCGFGVIDALEIYKYIVRYTRDSLKRINVLRDEIGEYQNSWMDNVQNHGMSKEDAALLVDKSRFRELMKEMITEIQQTYCVPVDELKRNFDESVVTNFVNTFVSKRKENDYLYYTEKNPFESAPLLLKGDNNLFVPLYKQLLIAINQFFVCEMEKSSNSNSYYRQRDCDSEKQSALLFERMFGDNAEYYSSIFERPDAHNEHDLIICYLDNLIIAEVKASKQKEPFRDPDKAYLRIKRDFKSDGGIQKAYNQGNNLKQLIMSNPVTNLYDRDGNVLYVCEREKFKNIYIVSVTVENYGIIASQLSLLLEKDTSEPYPWSCNLYDLETIINAFEFKKMGPERFLEYLDLRSSFHEKTFAVDELEICGTYMQSPQLKKVLSKKKQQMIFFSADMSDIFDDIYFEQKGLDIHNSTDTVNVTNISNELRKMNVSGSKKNDTRSNRYNKSKNKKIKKSRKQNRK